MFLAVIYLKLRNFIATVSSKWFFHNVNQVLIYYRDDHFLFTSRLSVHIDGFPAQKRDVIEEINAFCDKYYDNKYKVCFAIVEAHWYLCYTKIYIRFTFEYFTTKCWLQIIDDVLFITLQKPFYLMIRWMYTVPLYLRFMIKF